MAISVPPKGDADKKIGAYFAPLSVMAQSTPNFTVQIRAGWFYNSSGVATQYVGGNSPVLVPPGSYPVWAVVAISDAGSIVIVYGVASATPVLPELADGQMPLAFAYLFPGMTAVTNDWVYDARPLFQSTNSVPDLTAELADRPTFADVAADLASKADTVGTPSSTFTLSNGAVAPSNASFVVERGALVNVALRWNEATMKWQFTNDGSTYVDIASVSGTFMDLVVGPTLGDVLTVDGTGQAIDSGVLLTDLATTADVATDIDTKLDDFVGTNGNVVIVAGAGTAVADSGVLLGDLATDVELSTGLGLKADLTGDTFTGNITIDNGVDQPITLASIDSGSSGLVVDRSGVPGPDALLEWDESADQWMAGIIGAVYPLLTAANISSISITKSQISDFVEGAYVHTTGAESVGGVKTFTSAPVLPVVSKATLVLGAGNAVEAVGSVLFVNDDAGATTFAMACVDDSNTWVRVDDNTPVS